MGEPAPFLQEVVLQQLQELKEEQYVSTEVQDDGSDSEAQEYEDGDEGFNSVLELLLL